MKLLLPEEGHAPLMLTQAVGPGVMRVAVRAGEVEADVYIYGDIGDNWSGEGTTAEEFVKEIAGIEAATIHVHLNSPGGAIFDGVAIYNALSLCKAKVVVHIEGLAASIASVIAMAGDEIRIIEGAVMMIHRAWTFCAGDADVFRQEANVLEKLEGGILDIYQARTTQQREQLSRWMAAETWFTAQEAIDAGFADVLVPAKKPNRNAALQHSRMMPLFNHAPAGLEEEDPAPAVRVFERALREIGGLSHSQARRFAALAATTLQPVARDVRPEPPMTPALRDEGEKEAKSDALNQLIAAILSTAREINPCPCPSTSPN